MELNHLTPTTLSELIRIAEEKQTLLAKIEKIDASMETLIKNNSVAAASTKPAKPAKLPRKAATVAAKAAPAPVAPAPATEAAPKVAAPARAKRGALKEGILAALASAGSEGLSVGELSAKLGVEAANIHVWFSTTGKKLSEITKVAAGRYALAAAAPAGIEPAPAPSLIAEEIEAAVAPESEPVVIEIIEIEPEIPAASLAPEPELVSVVVEETPVIIESVIELEPEASAPEPEADEAATPGKSESFQLFSSN